MDITSDQVTDLALHQTIGLDLDLDAGEQEGPAPHEGDPAGLAHPFFDLLRASLRSRAAAAWSCSSSAACATVFPSCS